MVLIDLALLLFGLFLIVAVIGVVVVAVGALIGAVVFAILAALPAIAIGAAAALAISLGAPTLDPIQTGLLVALIVFPLALVRAVRKRGRARAAPLRAMRPAPERVLIDEPEPEPDTPLGHAWSEAEALAPAAGHRILAARRECEALLACAEGGDADWQAIDWAAMIRNTVPELVEGARDALDDGQADAGEVLVVALEQIAAEARRRLPATGSARRRFAILRAHVANRSGAGG